MEKDSLNASTDTVPVSPISVSISTTFATDSAESSDTTPNSIALSTTDFKASSPLAVVLSSKEIPFKSTSFSSFSSETLSAKSRSLLLLSIYFSVDIPASLALS